MSSADDHSSSSESSDDPKDHKHKSDKRKKSNSKKDKKKSKKRQKKDKNMPKRAMTAYIFFSNDHRDEVKKNNPEIKFGEVAKELSRMWKEAGPGEKKKYDERAQKDKQRYEKEMVDYKAKHKSSKKSKKDESSSESSDSDSGSD